VRVMTLTTRILVYVFLLYVARTLFPLLNMFVFLKKKKIINKLSKTISFRYFSHQTYPLGTP
jgi:hypothetical protein